MNLEFLDCLADIFSNCKANIQRHTRGKTKKKSCTDALKSLTTE